MKKITLNIIKTILFITVIWFIFNNVYSNLDRIKAVSYTNYDPKYLFFSVVMIFVALIYPVFVWKYLISILGESIKTPAAMRIWFLSNLGRYIPGKVFQVAGLIYLSAREGIAKSKAVQSILFSQITSNGLGLFMGLGLISLQTGAEEFPNHFHIALILIIIFILMLWFPSLIFRSSNFILKKINKDQIDQGVGKREYMIYLSLQIVNWMLMSISLAFLVKSYTDLSITQNAEVLYVLPLSWTIGILAVFAPGGIGVREGAMSFWLSRFIPIEFALVLPWIHRIINTIAEVILSVIFTVTYRKPETGIRKNDEQNTLKNS